MTATLRYSTQAEEGPLQVSKWLELQVLLEVEELRSLLDELQPACFYDVSSVHAYGQGVLDADAFIESYAHYLAELKAGRTPNQQDVRTAFSSVLSVAPDCLYGIQVGEDRQLIRACRPVIQLQPATLGIAEGKVRPKVHGPDAVPWGLQFGYPQLFQNPESKLIEKVDQSEVFPNTAVFRKLQKWIRRNTKPTPFLLEGAVVNSPVRIGNNCDLVYPYKP